MNVQPVITKSGILASLCLPAMLLAGCRVGPNYVKVTPPVPPAFTEQHADSGVGSPSPQQWWTIFHDPVLDGLEARTIRANLDIRIAVAQVDQADALRRAVRSGESPAIAAQPYYGRTREAQERPNNGNTNGQAATYNDLQLPLTLSYEIDAWGRIHRQVQSAVASEQASKDDLHFVQLTATSTVAVDYFALREADADAKLVLSVGEDLDEGLRVTTDQFRRGIISELAVTQAEAILNQARAQLQGIYLQRAQAEHAIAILTGTPAENFHIAEVKDQTNLVNQPAIPPGLPAAMLDRRPDVQAAERRVAAASEQIGIAKAAYYPQFVLNGNAGFESVNPTDIFAWQNTLASLIGSAVAPIFTGGRLRAGVDIASASYRQSVADYEKTVLVAFGDVEDQLSAIRYLGDQERAEAAVVKSAQRSAEIASNRYKAGLVSYLDVVFAQQTLLQNQQAVTQLQGQQAGSTVGLIRALGGGW